MSLNIFFIEDVTARLTALARANRRALALAELYGMDAATAQLCRDVYSGALSDVAAAFGLADGTASEKSVGTVLEVPTYYTEGR